MSGFVGEHLSAQALDDLAEAVVAHERDSEAAAHLQVCDRCRGEVERLGRVTAGLALLSTASVQDSRAFDRILAVSDGRKSRALRRWAVPAGALVVAVAILVTLRATLDRDVVIPPSDPTNVGFAPVRPAYFDRTLGAWSPAVLDSAIQFAARQPRARVVIVRRPDPAVTSAELQLADSTLQHLLTRGIARQRIQVTAAGGGSLPIGSIRVIVRDST
jgi:hypothetical protein